MPRELTIERDDGDEKDAMVAVTEPQVTRYTIAQAKQEVEMARTDLSLATERLAAAKAKADEAVAAVRASRERRR